MSSSGFISRWAQASRTWCLASDATLNGRPIFLADAQTFDRAKNTIALFRTRQADRLASVKELVS